MTAAFAPMRRLVHPLLLAILLLAAAISAASAQTNPFGRGTPSTPAGPGPETRREQPPAAEPGLLERWYGAYRRLQFELTRQQRELSDWLAEQVRAYKEHGSLAPILTILLISFLYGVVHAAGPGHGKAASAAYFGANRARAIHGIAMSALIGVVQALSAIVFVGTLVLVFGFGHTQAMRSGLYVEAASFALIAAVGLWIAWGGIIGRGCSHQHGPHANQDHGHDHDHGHKHEHKHDHSHAHAHDHALARGADHDDHAHGHPHAHGDATVAVAAPAITLRSMLPIALASGIRPCTGAILVLLFTLSQGIFEIGVLATLVMSLGTFLVVALIGLGVIYARRAVSRAGGRHERLANLAQRGVSLLGGLLVLAFGATFLLDSLQRLGFRI